MQRFDLNKLERINHRIGFFPEEAGIEAHTFQYKGYYVECVYFVNNMSGGFMPPVLRVRIYNESYRHGIERNLIKEFRYRGDNDNFDFDYYEKRLNEEVSAYIDNLV